MYFFSLLKTFSQITAARTSMLAVTASSPSELTPFTAAWAPGSAVGSSARLAAASESASGAAAREASLLRSCARADDYNPPRVGAAYQALLPVCVGSAFAAPVVPAGAAAAAVAAAASAAEATGDDVTAAAAVATAFDTIVHASSVQLHARLPAARSSPGLPFLNQNGGGDASSTLPSSTASPCVVAAGADIEAFLEEVRSRRDERISHKPKTPT